MKKLYDISEVCALLGTTSRALRYYEAEGLITSTVIYPSARRKYSDEQFGEIKRITAFRALGLPVKKIKALVGEKCSLKEAILSRRVDIIKLITENQRQINLLEEVLHNIDSDGEGPGEAATEIVCTDRQLEISRICTDAFLRGDYAAMAGYFSEDLRTLLPERALARSTEMTVGPLGKFTELGEMTRDGQRPNIVTQALKYELCGLMLKYVFHGDVIHGFWSQYI